MGWVSSHQTLVIEKMDPGSSQWFGYYIHIFTHALALHLCCPSWWRHQMEIFSELLALCARNSPVTSEFPSQRPVTWSFDVFFDLCLNKRLTKSWGWWFQMPSPSLWCHCNVTVFLYGMWGGSAPCHLHSLEQGHILQTIYELIIEILFKSTWLNYDFNDFIKSLFVTCHDRSCCGMCKIVTWSDHYFSCVSNINFHKLSMTS